MSCSPSVPILLPTPYLSPKILLMVTLTGWRTGETVPVDEYWVLTYLSHTLWHGRVTGRPICEVSQTISECWCFDIFLLHYYKPEFSALYLTHKIHSFLSNHRKNNWACVVLCTLAVRSWKAGCRWTSQSTLIFRFIAHCSKTNPEVPLLPTYPY